MIVAPLLLLTSTWAANRTVTVRSCRGRGTDPYWCSSCSDYETFNSGSCSMGGFMYTCSSGFQEYLPVQSVSWSNLNCTGNVTKNQTLSAEVCYSDGHGGGWDVSCGLGQFYNKTRARETFAKWYQVGYELYMSNGTSAPPARTARALSGEFDPWEDVKATVAANCEQFRKAIRNGKIAYHVWKGDPEALRKDVAHYLYDKVYGDLFEEFGGEVLEKAWKWVAKKGAVAAAEEGAEYLVVGSAALAIGIAGAEVEVPIIVGGVVEEAGVGEMLVKAFSKTAAYLANEFLFDNLYENISYENLMKYIVNPFSDLVRRESEAWWPATCRTSCVIDCNGAQGCGVCMGEGGPGSGGPYGACCCPEGVGYFECCAPPSARRALNASRPGR